MERKGAGPPIFGAGGASPPFYGFEGVGADEVYDTIPILFVNLDKPGVRDKCVAQFNSAPLVDHDPLSSHVMAEGTPSGRMWTGSLQMGVEFQIHLGTL